MSNVTKVKTAAITTLHRLQQTQICTKALQITLQVKYQIDDKSKLQAKLAVNTERQLANIKTSNKYKITANN